MRNRLEQKQPWINKHNYGDTFIKLRTISIELQRRLLSLARIEGCWVGLYVRDDLGVVSEAFDLNTKYRCEYRRHYMKPGSWQMQLRKFSNLIDVRLIDAKEGVFDGKYVIAGVGLFVKEKDEKPLVFIEILQELRLDSRCTNITIPTNYLEIWYSKPGKFYEVKV